MSQCVSDGKYLFIRDDWQTDWNKPEQYRLYWPIGLMAHEYPEIIDKPAVSLGGGVYRINGLSVVLENREKTTPAKADTRPVEKPRNAKEWRNGRWFEW